MDPAREPDVTIQAVGATDAVVDTPGDAGTKSTASGSAGHPVAKSTVTETPIIERN